LPLVVLAGTDSCLSKSRCNETDSLHSGHSEERTEGRGGVSIQVAPLQTPSLMTVDVSCYDNKLLIGCKGKGSNSDYTEAKLAYVMGLD
jgi:hypothetical protein